MRGTHPNLVYVPASKDKKGRERPAHWQTEITLNYRRIRRYAGTTKEEALIYLGEMQIGRFVTSYAEVKDSRPFFLVNSQGLIEIAQSVLYLVSDAASYVTGAVLAVDGGGTA